MTMDPKMNGQHWRIKETRLRILGRCHTLNYVKKVRKLDLLAARIIFQHNSSIMIAMHEPGEELWFSEGLMPASVKFHNVDLKVEDIGGGDVFITKRTTKVMGSKSSPCFLYKSNTDFTSCAKKQANLFASNFTCITPFTKQLVTDNVTMPFCSERLLSSETTKKVGRMMLDLAISPGDYGCQRPCREVQYEASISLYSKSTSVFPPNIGPGLHFAYNTLDVENKEEKLLYDFPNLVSAIGGSMGLFLGLSLLDILKRCIQQYPQGKRSTMYHI